jgi:transposase
MVSIGVAARVCKPYTLQTNNQEERDLRMMKAQQKVAGCFRCPQGIVMFCRIRSYRSTLRKQRMEVLPALERAMTGHPVLPDYS